ncbi:hypothetical protein K2Z84_33260 [Candidatus Binatia bacterium]|nr:hypothetical protein [Candidatus Binatia bacterium]
MAIVVESPERREDLVALIRLHEAVYAGRRARWGPEQSIELPLLTGESPFAADRRLRPFVARENGRPAARAVAVVDERYRQHWHENIGHVVLFEALPGARDAATAVLEAACAWLAREGVSAARAGFGVFDFPFVTDAYDPLPPSVLRHNPPEYHAMLQAAGFAPERRFVDYKITVTPALRARWEAMVDAGRRAGFDLVWLRDVPLERRAPDLHLVWDDAFRAHWGYTPFSEDELSLVIASLTPAGMLDCSVLAYRDGEPVGALWLVPETSAYAVLSPGHQLAADERLNTLAIAVREPARRQGVNLAIAARGYLELVRRGARFLSYTLVLDDNGPSRRTAEKLGATVCAHYVAYRRELRR